MNRREQGRPKLRLEYIPAGKLRKKANPLNWRIHGAGQRKALAAALAELGWAGACLLNETTGRLIDGHLRIETVPPKTAVPVLVGRWTEEQERKILATLDPLSAMAEADGDKLRDLLTEIGDLGEGYGDLAAELREMAEAAGGEKPDTLNDPDDVPAPPDEAVTKPGDLWLLGDHRLFCADSREARVAKTIGAPEAVGVIFDPPFTDDYADWTLPANSAVHCVWHRGLQGANAMLIAHPAKGWSNHDLVMTGMAGGHTNPQVPCLIHATVTVFRSRRVKACLDRVVINAIGAEVDAMGRPFSVVSKALIHRKDVPHAKSVRAMAVCLAYVPAGACVYEPCAGSGTTIIAGEQHGRRILACEVEPLYCDVIIRRWERFTGQKARLQRKR